MIFPVIHLRAETKPSEHRSVISPSGVQSLIAAGYSVNVERSPERCFPDSDFERVGASIVPEGSWPGVPIEHIILGLKELPEDDFPLKHTHIYFGHVFKNQTGWKRVFKRFKAGEGTLLDLEFFSEPSGKPLAPTSFYVGYAGAALAVKAWAHQLVQPSAHLLPSVAGYATNETLLADVRACLSVGSSHLKRPPKVIIFGAKGHCGKGAVELCIDAGIPVSSILQWGRVETAKGGPFSEAIESDILLNCIHLDEQITPFVTRESLESPLRNLSVISDISCDVGDDKNPIPIYSNHTTFEEPTVQVHTQR